MAELYFIRIMRNTGMGQRYHPSGNEMQDDEIEGTNSWVGTVAQWLRLLPCSKKVLGSNLNRFCVESACSGTPVSS